MAARAPGAAQEPFQRHRSRAAARHIETLPGIDPQSWAGHWPAGAEDFAARARTAEESGDRDEALESWRAGELESWWQAYQFAFLGRYPSPLHPAKQHAYDRAVEYFGRVSALERVPVRHVTLPFDGRAEEGEVLRFFVARPPTPIASGWPPPSTGAGACT
ncbi:hypothetical protein ACFZBU_42925 [Embleya sp. NPDC008237]|uniref:hypothetical protein n=1 Tax=Embleya sp. NPDC008237 TaxID=3363978 RepID=UPI0036ED4FD5